MRTATSKQFSVVKYLVENKANIYAEDKYGLAVVDVLESNIRRSGTNEEKMVETMRRQGLMDAAINKLLGWSISGAARFTESDRIAWQEILDFIKDAAIKQK